MLKKVTQIDIENMNEIYLKVGTYAATARKTGFSASTVKRYIIPNYISKENLIIRSYDPLPHINDYNLIFNISLSDKEIEQIADLWNEITI